MPCRASARVGDGVEAESVCRCARLLLSLCLIGRVMPGEVDEEEVKNKKAMKSLLNKLTVEKFDSLSQQILELLVRFSLVVALLHACH